MSEIYLTQALNIRYKKRYYWDILRYFWYLSGKYLRYNWDMPNTSNYCKMVRIVKFLKMWVNECVKTWLLERLSPLKKVFMNFVRAPQSNWNMIFVWKRWTSYHKKSYDNFVSQFLQNLKYWNLKLVFLEFFQIVGMCAQFLYWSNLHWHEHQRFSRSLFSFFSTFLHHNIFF